jgi:hypothetical protein
MKIWGRGSKPYGIVKMKCPRCQEGNLFVHPNAYKPGEMAHMHEHCSHCDLKFQLEPSFFYGSMYVSYAFTVAAFVAVYLVMQWLGDPGLLTIIGVLTAVLLLLSPWVFRLSRATWLHIFVGYQPEKRGPQA